MFVIFCETLTVPTIIKYSTYYIVSLTLQVGLRAATTGEDSVKP